MKALVSLLIVAAPVLAHADAKLEKGATWDCKKDPNVTIPNGMGTFTFKGACKSIAIGGGKNTLTVESVETLDIGGGMNTVTAKSADTIKIGGAKNTITVDTVGMIHLAGVGNTITWKKAKTGDKPMLHGQTDGNTITQGK